VKTLLVIGGSGYFGKSILDLFQRGGLAPWGIGRVIAMARSASRLRSEAPQLLSANVELLDADIASVDTLPQADFVIHAAASTDAARYLSQPLEERRNIQAGTYNYCDLARQFHRDSKILYVSSGAVYGTQAADLEALSEDYVVPDPADIPEGKRDYACAKRDAEAAVQALAAEGLQLSIARCFAFVGPWLPRDQHFAIGNFIADALAGRPITVKAQHRVYRSYMHSDDLVEWLMTMCAHADTTCPVYNVGSGHAVLMGELARHVAAPFGVPVSVPEISSDRVDRYIPSVEKAERELGLRLRYELDDAIRATLHSLRAVQR
jgi:nucleoside-diphosphate-sugar epimerase